MCLVTPRHVGYSWTMGIKSCVPCIGRWFPYNRITRKALKCFLEYTQIQVMRIWHSCLEKDKLFLLANNWFCRNSVNISEVALVVKNPPANAGDIRDTGSIPGSGRSSGEGYGNLLQYSCLENPMDRGAWGTTVHRVTQSQTRLKRLSMRACRFLIYKIKRDNYLILKFSSKHSLEFYI